MSQRSSVYAALLWMAGAWLAGVAAQNAPTFPVLLSDLTGPAIDRGLRDSDPPRAPRSERGLVIDDDTLFLRGSLIVKFRPGTSAEARRLMLARVDGVAGSPLSYADFDIVSIDPAANPEAVAQSLDVQPDVEYAQARYRVYPHFVPNDPMYAQQWNYRLLDMERAWDINRGAAPSVTVAVLDTGVAYRSGVFGFNARSFRVGTAQCQTNGTCLTFPALGPVDVPFAAAPDLAGPDRFVAPRDFIWDTVLPLDLDGHGTHVSGTVGQLTNNSVGAAGMAFNVRMMPVKVISGDWDFIFGSPFQGTDDVVARGVRYAADSGAKVLNMSIGRTGDPSPVVQEAIVYAVSRGVFVVVSAGNAFLSGNPVERLAEFAPEIDGMVAVGAVGRTRTRAPYSSSGPYVELVAPGGDQRFENGGTTGGILQQTLDFDLTETYVNGRSNYRAPRFDSFAFEFFQGTSMAAPHVSGFAAMLIQQGITSPAAIEEIMKRYATDLGPPGRDNEYGFGLIDPRAALRGMGLAK